MSWYAWDGYRGRRRPTNGIKAQTQRGQFGKTWWAGRWIAALERLVDPGRLTRGRSYARSGQVLSLAIGRAGIEAQVQGSRPQPYQVDIRFRTLTDAEWDKVVDAMAAEALYAARLLSGEMPEQIEEVFQAAGASLFPAVQGDLETDCSCPDWANPCKHVAAVHYLLGERFEADPWLIFELRGRDQAEIAAALRERRAGHPSPDGVAAEEGSAEDEEPVLPVLGESPHAFWSMPQGTPELALTFDPPAVDALPLKRLGAPPFWRDPRDFTSLMEEAYRSIGNQARDLARGEQ